MIDEIVMYILVNRDLPMEKGKLAAQVAHSACKASHAASISSEHRNTWESWFGGSYTKIVLKSNEFEMKKILEQHFKICYVTYDEGRTQIAKNSLTTLAFIPMLKSQAPEEIKYLKLL